MARAFWFIQVETLLKGSCKKTMEQNQFPSVYFAAGWRGGENANHMPLGGQSIVSETLLYG
jgi:hypothetical protein